MCLSVHPGLSVCLSACPRPPHGPFGAPRCPPVSLSASQAPPCTFQCISGSSVHLSVHLSLLCAPLGAPQYPEDSLPKGPRSLRKPCSPCAAAPEPQGSLVLHVVLGPMSPPASPQTPTHHAGLWISPVALQQTGAPSSSLGMWGSSTALLQHEGLGKVHDASSGVPHEFLGASSSRVPHSCSCHAQSHVQHCRLYACSTSGGWPSPSVHPKKTLPC